MYIVPVTSYPDQIFNTVVDGQTVKLRFFWNVNSKAWYADISGVSFDLEVHGQRVCVNRPLLRGLAVREIGDFLCIDKAFTVDPTKAREPTREGFGTDWFIVYATKEDLGYDLV